MKIRQALEARKGPFIPSNFPAQGPGGVARFFRHCGAPQIAPSSFRVGDVRSGRVHAVLYPGYSLAPQA